MQDHCHQKHKADVAVIGGGLSGMLAAIAAARHGARVVLMQDRPVLGGNCSSEIRMWSLGCHGRNNEETGILEEIFLENMYRNPTRNFSVWDSVLYEKVKAEPNITLLLNCSCCRLAMDGDRIRSVTGWQTTTYTWHTVEAKIFADCSGDSVLAPMCGAEYRMGREARGEYGEDIAPETADRKTMGMTCMIQARETGRPSAFIPPEWAYVYPDDSCFPHRPHDLSDPTMNYWWMELGGEQDCIRDAEEIRDELLKVAFGVWDHIKNRGDHHAENWELEWVGFLPGKRESIRYIGDYVMTQNDVQAGGHFEDLAAYGGWTMDDHNPAGFRWPGEPTIHHPAPAPFGIPYRSMYSRNIGNLMFAGRNISVTHTAMSASRVMSTCAVIGQAVGTAAALAVSRGWTPRDVWKYGIGELQQMLMDDDCYLPGHTRQVSELSRSAALSGTGSSLEALRSGADRPIGEEDNGCHIPLGGCAEYRFGGMRQVRGVRITFDSDLERETCTGHKVLRKYPMLCNRFLDMESFGFPTVMVRRFRVEYQDEAGNWRTAYRCADNRQRLVRAEINAAAQAVRLIPEETWGSPDAHLFAFEVN